MKIIIIRSSKKYILIKKNNTLNIFLKKFVLKISFEKLINNKKKKNFFSLHLFFIDFHLILAFF